jgi:hypothetical protein
MPPEARQGRGKEQAPIPARYIGKNALLIRKESSNRLRRKVGAYYTPPRLAELVVDIATEGWDTLLDKRYLDPACGSGVCRSR